MMSDLCEWVIKHYSKECGLWRSLVNGLFTDSGLSRIRVVRDYIPHTPVLLELYPVLLKPGTSVCQV